MLAKNLSEHTRRHRSEYSRKYKERERRAGGVEPRALKLLDPSFDPEKLVAWLTERMKLVNTPTGSELVLNGRKFEDIDDRYLNHLRGGTVKRASLKRVDEIATRYELPLWEMIEVAGRYKIDKRRRKHKRRIT